MGTPWQHPDGYLYTKDVAAIFRCSVKTVTRWAREGKLPFLRTLGGHRRYPEKEIREMVDLRWTQPSDADTRRLHQ